MSAPMTPIDQAMAELDSIWAESREIRREQIKNLREVCNNPEMKISPYDKAMMIQSKLAIINTIDSLLKSDENNSLQKAKMYLARKDSETNGQVGSTIICSRWFESTRRTTTSVVHLWIPRLSRTSLRRKSRNLPRRERTKIDRLSPFPMANCRLVTVVLPRKARLSPRPKQQPRQTRTTAKKTEKTKNKSLVQLPRSSDGVGKL